MKIQHPTPKKPHQSGSKQARSTKEPLRGNHMEEHTTPSGNTPDGNQSARQVQNKGEEVAAGQKHRTEQAGAGISAEDHQKFKEMLNAMIDEEYGMRSSFRRTYNSEGELVAVSSGWHHMDDDDDDDLEEFVNNAFDAIEEEFARQAHEASPSDVIDGQANPKPDRAQEESESTPLRHQPEVPHAANANRKSK